MKIQGELEVKKTCAKYRWPQTYLFDIPQIDSGSQTINANLMPLRHVLVTDA